MFYCCTCTYRSKLFVDKSPEPAIKRLYINKQIRQERMNEIEHELQRIKEGIQYKEKRRAVAETSKNYKLCEELTDTIRESEREARKLELELKNYHEKEKKSLSYKKKRSTSSSESDVCPRAVRPRLASSNSGGSTEIWEQSSSCASPSTSILSETVDDPSFEPQSPTMISSPQMFSSPSSPASVPPDDQNNLSGTASLGDQSQTHVSSPDFDNQAQVIPFPPANDAEAISSNQLQNASSHSSSSNPHEIFQGGLPV